MSEASTLTVGELVKLLDGFPSDAKVFMSSDEEGNGYGSIASDSIEAGSLDNVIVFYPSQERLYYDDICPNQYAFEMEAENGD